MFSNRTVNPSPNRTSIKEANDHLQLLHQRVMELETTTQEQAEALRKKDDYLHATLRELSELKDSEINDLTTVISQLKDRVRKLEHIVKDKDHQIEQLTFKVGLVEDVSSYTPTIEKLLSAMKKLPSKSNIKPDRKKARINKCQISRKSFNDIGNNVDGHMSVTNQSLAEMSISRSFNINSNFSLSEDEQQSEIL